jgi:transposase-like protein
MKNLKSFKSLFDLRQALPTEQACIKHYEQLRWPNGVISPFDPTSKVYYYRNRKYRCKNTGRNFNVKTGTIFENSKIPLQKWLFVIWLDTSHKKGISSCQLARDVGVTQKTAWFMLQRMREGFYCENQYILDGEVELDETFVGGKNKNRHKDKKVKNSRGRSFKDKTPVFGMLERKGKVVSSKQSSEEHF